MSVQPDSPMLFDIPEGISTERSPSRLGDRVSGPGLTPPAFRAGVNLDEDTIDYGVQAVGFLAVEGIPDQRRMVVELRSVVGTSHRLPGRGVVHLFFASFAMCSRPYRRVLAIHISSARKPSIRCKKRSSSSCPSSPNTPWTLGMLTSRLMGTSP